jgi:RHS repeat-associated protein
MAGISSKALKSGCAENKIKYNNMELQSSEFSDGVGLEMYEYKYRFYDHQIGRFISQDKLADKYPYYAPYQFAGNEVPNAIDLDGLEPLRPNRNMERSQYADNRRSYREVNGYVPRPSSYRNSSIYIPNQQAGSAPRPANIYEDFKPGTGDQHTGPFITRGNSIGKTGVIMTEAVNDLKEQIQRVTVTTDNLLANNQFNTSSSIKIEWKSKEAENKFNALQSAYDDKVSEIRNNNKLPEPPGAGASKEDWQSWANESQKVVQNTNLALTVLGSSPTQVILNNTMQSDEYRKVKTETMPLPEIRPARQ